MPINLDDLKANIQEYIEVGEMAFKQGKYNSATVMYFQGYGWDL